MDGCSWNHFAVGTNDKYLVIFAICQQIRRSEAIRRSQMTGKIIAGHANENLMMSTHVWGTTLYRITQIKKEIRCDVTAHKVPISYAYLSACRRHR